MTNAIEQTRREMYRQLAILKTAGIFSADILGFLESALEAHLEELRKDRKFCESVVELSEAKAASAKKECDELRNKLQAFEFANKSAGELLSHAQGTVKRQRRIIKALCASQEARDGDAGTLMPNEKESSACSGCGGSGRILVGEPKGYGPLFWHNCHICEVK